MKSRAGEGTAGNSTSLPHGAHDFIANLERAAAGDPDAQQRMNGTLQRAALRDDRNRTPPDRNRERRNFDALRAAERGLVAINDYGRCRTEREARKGSRRAA